ncbi:MAG: type II toxin-antitoxin system prevent-host-death family antitoxin [Deltaproteobacteria bacterium]|nr:type II toxin-antitoxin system prevent-host-death family antitoxin [Deltaproteobacteria bacterium]
MVTVRRKSVGARELKTRLGGYLRAVRGGLVIIVTERGEPVAELRPLAARPRGVKAGLEDLERRGMISRASGEPLASFEPVPAKGRAMSELISEEREDRFG